MCFSQLILIFKNNSLEVISAVLGLLLNFVCQPFKPTSKISTKFCSPAFWNLGIVALRLRYFNKFLS